MRMTQQRKAILNLFKETIKPKTVAMILDELPENSMNLSTIYRILDSFFTAGLILKSTMNNTTYFYLNKKDHNHYMICTTCQKMHEIGCLLGNEANTIAKQHNFKITHHDMTFYGICETCQNH